MNPLDRILEWFNEQEKEYQLELVTLVAHFHPDESILRERDEDERIEKFRSYLGSSSLNEKEILMRTVIMKGLIGFCLSGKDTEYDWEEKRQSNLAALEEFQKQGFTENPASTFLANYQRVKNTWIKWADEWNTVSEYSLSSDELREWHMDCLSEYSQH